MVAVFECIVNCWNLHHYLLAALFQSSALETKLILTPQPRLLKKSLTLDSTNPIIVQTEGGFFLEISVLRAIPQIDF